MWYACTWTENLLKDTHSLIHLFIYFSLVLPRASGVDVSWSRDITSLASLTRAHPGRIDDIIHPSSTMDLFNKYAPSALDRDIWSCLVPFCF